MSVSPMADLPFQPQQYTIRGTSGQHLGQRKERQDLSIITILKNASVDKPLHSTTAQATPTEQGQGSNRSPHGICDTSQICYCWATMGTPISVK